LPCPTSTNLHCGFLFNTSIPNANSPALVLPRPRQAASLTLCKSIVSIRDTKHPTSRSRQILNGFGMEFH
jgi:hypothetical protein